MSYTVDVNLDGLEEMFSDERLGKAQLLCAQSVESDCRPLVPWETETLKKSVTVEKDNVSWNTDYAIYAYYMRGKPSKPGTYPEWFEVASRRHLHDWERTVGEYLVNGGR